MKTLKDQNELTFLLMLLGADVAFIAVYLINAYTPYASGDLFKLNTDRGYSEISQYIKETWISAILFAFFIKKRQILYATWSLLFGYLFLDDSFRIHEEMGRIVAQYLHYVPFMKLRPVDFGQLTVSVAGGVVFLSLIGAAYRFSGPEDRRVCKHLVFLLGVIVFFGVFVDAVHVVLQSERWNPVLVVVEEGGEMLAMSVTCWYVFSRWSMEN
jgi:hypothetical protein